jgi:hypothetical protein
MREEEPENGDDAPDLALPNGETFPERLGPRADPFQGASGQDGTE